MRNCILFLMCCLCLSCSLFEREDLGKPVARVGDAFFYEKDVLDVMQQFPEQDSSSVVSRRLNEWAKEQLLLQGAYRNLTKEEQEIFNTLVENYKKDLFTRTYKDALLSDKLDSIVSIEEATSVYEDQKNNFLLNEPLVQYRYILLEENTSDERTIRDHFKSFLEDDKAMLDSLKYQFKESYLNDSTWVTEESVVRRINSITPDNADRLLKKSNFLQLRDSLGLYLIAIENTLSRKQIAPLDYVRPTINKIIINKRKLELSKQLEIDIVKDAIKEKEYEVFK